MIFPAAKADLLFGLRNEKEPGMRAPFLFVAACASDRRVAATESAEDDARQK